MKITEFFHRFYEALSRNQLKIYLPEIEALKNVPEMEEHHPERNTFSHTMLTLEHAENNVPAININQVKFGLIFHDIGKLMTPKEILPHHYGHEERGIEIVENVCNRLNIEYTYKNIAVLSIKYHLKLRRICGMRIGHIFDMIRDITNDFSDILMLEILFQVSESDLFGRRKKPSEKQITKLEKSKGIAYNMYTIFNDIKLNISFQTLRRETLLNYYCNKINK